MKDYTKSDPNFSEKIIIVEEGDLVNDDNANAAPKQLLENDLFLKKVIETEETRVQEAENAIQRILNRLNITYEDDTRTLKFGNTSDSGETTGYMLPKASTTQLGGVKIGDGIVIDGDGTISVDASAVAGSTVAGVLKNSIAPDSEVKEMLTEVLG